MASTRKQIRPAAVAALSAATALTAATLTVTPATANPYQPNDPSLRREARTGQVYTLSDSPLCAGAVRAMMSTQPYMYPDGKPVSNLGKVSYSLSANLFGISGTPRYCTVQVTLAWRNTTTGRSGSVVRTASGPPLTLTDATSGMVFGTVTTGSGQVEFTLRPHRPHLAGQAVSLNVF